MIARGDILAALESVRGAVPAKPFMPILAHVLVDGKTVIAYDNEVAIKASLPTDCGICFNVPHDKFYQLMKNLDGEEVDIRLDGKKVHISSGKHKSTMMQIVEEEFPRPVVEMSGMDWSPVPAGFKEALERALMAASNEEANRVISGVLVSGSRVYGVDGQKCTRCTLPELNVTIPMLLSRKAVEEIIRLGNPSRLVVAGPWAVFDYTNLTFLARLREGASDFPPCDKIFDNHSNYSKEIIPIPERLPNVLLRLKLFGGFKPRATINPTALGPVELTAGDELGSAAEYIDPQAGLVKKTFSPDLMLLGLQYADGMNWGNGENGAIYLKGEHAGFEFLLMPMR